MFHLTGAGMDEARPQGGLHPVALDDVLQRLPVLESEFPVYAAPGKAPHPLNEITADTREVIAAMRGRALAPATAGPGWLIGFHRDALPLLYGACLAAARDGARSKFFLGAKRCVARLQDLLSVDAANRTQASPESISASLGAAADRFLAASALPEVLDGRKGPRSIMDADRRTRCESALKTLEEALRGADAEPAFWLFHSGDAPPDLEAFHGRASRAEDSCAAALDFCIRQLDRFVTVLQAIRVARLEVESAFDPAIHEELLRRFDWRSAEPDELAAMPAVVVAEDAARLADPLLSSFGRLLCSGRPVHILASSSGFDMAEIPDLGHLAMAYREAFVLQSSLANPGHLTKGLLEMAAALRPAVAVVAVPQDGKEMWLETAVCCFSRAFPHYTYDPHRGKRWADLFQMLDAPLDVLIAMAASRRFGQHFRIIPETAWDGDQMEASEYLEKFVDAPPPTVPYLRVRDREGREQRAAFTRDLAGLCRDRELAWEMLAGLASRPAPKTAAPAPASEEAAKQQGARQAYDRVLALLSDPQVLAPAISPAPQGP